jgi:uncharacterized protein (TIGR03083 family)
MTERLSRDALTAEFTNLRREVVSALGDLTLEQWEAGSLCDGWKVRDVVGHLLHFYDLIRRPHTVAGIARAGLRVNRYLADEARKRAVGRTPSELVAGIGAASFERSIFWKVGPLPTLMIVEFVIHIQDIRRPLGIDDRPGLTYLKIAADVFGRPARRLDPFRPRLPATRYEATDTDWTSGEGPLVRGPLEAIVMTLAGRAAALRDLSGDGVAQLKRHLMQS